MMSTPLIKHTLRALALAIALTSTGGILAQDTPAGGGEQPAANEAATRESTRYERNFIVDGNKLYRQQRYAEAERMYKKALEINPLSPEARFNLAAAYIRQSGSADPNADRNPLGDAQKLLTELTHFREDMSHDERRIASLAEYNLGNIAFNNNDFQTAVNRYKQSLRIDPDDDRARQNLRLAQLKLREQQNQDQNKDQDKKDQNQDQDQKQDQQNQDKNQNQDQDKNSDKNQDHQNQQDQQQGQDENKDKQKPERERSGMSDAAAQQILKAMENEEAATRKRVEAERRKSEAAKRRRVTNPW